MQAAKGQNELAEHVGYLWTWWKGDELPLMPPLTGWHVETSEDLPLVAKISNLPISGVEARYREGHRPALAYLNKTLVAYGWLASNRSSFGSPSVSFNIPVSDLYLYHFVTMMPWRGRGFYPRLLQEILLREESTIERFWIIHQSSNQASRRGIAKAGFHLAAQVFHSLNKDKTLVPDDDLIRARAGAALLGLPLLEN
jgi:hypothetical protein